MRGIIIKQKKAMMMRGMMHNWVSPTEFKPMPLPPLPTKQESEA